MPTQEIEFLGFVLNSVEMKIKLTDCKSGKIISKIKKLLYEGKQTIRDLASVIGSLVATFPVLPYGKLHYRELERCKISSLKFQNGKYNAPCIPLSTSTVAELHWCLKHLKNANQWLQDIPVDCTIQTDASKQEWDATDGNTVIGGRWERNHINVLELKVILLALKSYFRHNCNVKHVHILTNNSTALAYINNMRGMHSVICNDIAKRIWEFAQQRDFWISSNHISGVESILADKMCLLDVSPYCIVVNAFNFSWNTHKIYAFSPFSLVGAAISKLITDNTIEIMIIPKWTTQHWFTTMFAHLIDHPIQLPSGLITLSLPSNTSKNHPLSPKLQLLAVILSGNPLHSLVFREKLKNSSLQPGNLKLPQNTNLSLTDGNFFVYEEVKNVIHHL